MQLRHIVSSRLVKNSAWSLLDLAIYPLLMVIATPFLIAKLGAAQYGLWMLISNITQLMNVMNMGVGDSTIRRVSASAAAGDQAARDHAVNMNVSLSIVLLILAGLAGCVLSWGMSRFDWFDAQETYHAAGFVLLMASLSAGFKFIESVFLSVFKGMERFDISARLSLVSRNSVTIVTLLVLAAGYGLREMALAMACVNILNLALQVIVLKNKVKGITLLPRFRFGAWRDMFGHNGWYWLQSVIALLGFVSDKFLVAWFTDLETLGYYSVASLIASQVHNVLLTLGGFIFPKVSSRSELQEDSVPVYYVSRFAIAVLGWAGIALLYACGGFAFRWWLGDETYARAATYIDLYLGFEAIILLIIVPYHFLNGSPFIRLNSLFELLLRTSHVLLMVLMYRLIGVTGLLWGQIIGTLINLPFQYIVFHRIVLQDRQWPDPVMAVLPAFLIAAMLLFRESGWVLLPLVLTGLLITRKTYAVPAFAFIKRS